MKQQDVLDFIDGTEETCPHAEHLPEPPVGFTWNEVYDLDKDEFDQLMKDADYDEDEMLVINSHRNHKYEEIEEATETAKAEGSPYTELEELPWHGGDTRSAKPSVHPATRSI